VSSSQAAPPLTPAVAGHKARAQSASAPTARHPATEPSGSLSPASTAHSVVGPAPEAQSQRPARSSSGDLGFSARRALRAAKQAIREGASLPLVQGLELEQRCFDRVMRSKDAAGAMRAMLEGRRYEWQGE
jgi:enoyl-CoA hydratase/carnithine racemase